MSTSRTSRGFLAGLLCGAVATLALAQETSPQAPSAQATSASNSLRVATAAGVVHAARVNQSTPTSPPPVDHSKPETARDSQAHAPETARDHDDPRTRPETATDSQTHAPETAQDDPTGQPETARDSQKDAPETAVDDPRTLPQTATDALRASDAKAQSKTPTAVPNNKSPN